MAGSIVASMYPMTVLVSSVSVSEKAQMVTFDGVADAG